MKCTIGKLSVINYKIATYEGIANANTRLASQCDELRLLSGDLEVPEIYKDEFNSLIDLINNTLKITEGRVPSSIRGIDSKTAVHYISMLISIQLILEYK